MTKGNNHLYETVRTILALLFEKEEQHLAKRETDLVTRNIQLGGTTDGFRHMGVIYSLLTGRFRKLGQYKPPMPELIPELGALQTDRKILDTDKERIKMALTMVLMDCRTFQDYRDALPNGIGDLVPECRTLSRTREEAYTLRDNKLAYSQYMKLRDKMEFYLATRLLY